MSKTITDDQKIGEDYFVKFTYGVFNHGTQNWGGGRGGVGFGSVKGWKNWLKEWLGVRLC